MEFINSESANEATLKLLPIISTQRLYFVTLSLLRSICSENTQTLTRAHTLTHTQAVDLCEDNKVLNVLWMFFISAVYC